MKKIKHWNEKVDQLFEIRNLHPKTNIKKYDILEEFYERFLESGWYYHSLYGDGSAGINISNLLEEKSPSINKKLSY